MEFKKAQTGVLVWGDPSEEDKLNNVPENLGMRNSSVTIIRDKLKEYFKNGGSANENQKKDPLNVGHELFTLFRLLAVCHTVVVDKDPKTGEIIYQASSPDELALIQGACHAGLVLLEKSPSEMVIKN